MFGTSQPGGGSQSMSQDMVQAVRETHRGHTICVETIGHCLRMGGEHADAEHIKLLMDCAQICEVSADFMTRMSRMHPQVCGVCADTCAACATSREGVGQDEQMRRCIEACRACEAACRPHAQAVA